MTNVNDLDPEPRTLNPHLFTGDANEALARVYASLPREGLPPGARLTGEVDGPYCRFSKTLPAKIGFVDRGPGQTLLAEAVVPDPCFWTPELPFTYLAELHVDHGSSGPSPLGRRAVGAARRQGEGKVNWPRQVFGIRRLGTHQRSIYLDAKRFVFRGVYRQAIDEAALLEARKVSAAVLTTNLSDALCREATEAGVLLVVDLTKGNQFPGGTGSRATQRSSSESLTGAIVRLARWPAVAVIVLDADAPHSNELRAAARNTLIAQRIAENQPVRAAPWAKCILWKIDSQLMPRKALNTDLPVIVYRRAASQATIQEARAACDRLQADLTPLGDFAGYFS